MNTIEVNGKIESLRKETEDIKKSQMKNLEMKNTSVKIKILLDGLSSRKEMMDLNSNVPIIILNVTGLITVIKRQRLSEWIQKTRPN